MSIFVFLKILSNLMLPPSSLAIGVMLWLIMRLAGWRRLGFVTLALAIVQTLLLSIAPVSNLLVARLENQANKIIAGNPPCCYDAIVVLGGGIAPATPPYSMEPDLTGASDRIWLAARMFHAGEAPKIIVSGGSFIEQNGGPATTEAEAMRRFLLALGVPSEAIVSEGMALNTIANIRNVREMVKDSRVAIITSAFHIPRAAALARRAGLNFAIFGIDWSVPDDATLWWEYWLPTLSSLGDSNLAVKELLAMIFDRRGDSLAP